MAHGQHYVKTNIFHLFLTVFSTFYTIYLINLNFSLLHTQFFSLFLYLAQLRHVNHYPTNDGTAPNENVAATEKFYGCYHWGKFWHAHQRRMVVVSDKSRTRNFPKQTSSIGQYYNGIYYHHCLRILCTANFTQSPCKVCLYENVSGNLVNYGEKLGAHLVLTALISGAHASWSPYQWIFTYF